MARSKIYFIASIKEENIDDINLIAQKLEDKGCTVSNILPITGVITGSTFSSVSIEELKVKGIGAIEIDRTVKAIHK